MKSNQKPKPGRKPGPAKVKQILSLPIDARDKLHAMAGAEGITISQWVERRIKSTKKGQ